MKQKKFVILIASTCISAFLGAAMATSLAVNNAIRPAVPEPPKVVINQVPPPPLTLNQNKDLKQLIKTNNNAAKTCLKESQMVHKNPVPREFPFIANNILRMDNSASLRMTENKDYYKFIINLCPLNNDPKNVSIKMRNNNITISGNYESKDKNNNFGTHFEQSIILPFNVNQKQIKKETKGHNLIVTIKKEKP